MGTGSTARFYVGTSGWHYSGWRGTFYPQDLPKEKWLGFYATRFPAVEINNTFYHLPRESTFRAWREQSSPGFLFALKASRLITHLKRLVNIQEPLENFIQRARLLGDRLGPVLYQLPPGLRRNDTLLDEFLAALPRDLLHAVEFRNDTWYQDGVLDLLRRYNVAFCIHDFAQKESPVVATASFAYVRFHGPTGRYAGSYSDEVLAAWADRLARLCRGLQSAFVFFNNDVGGHAVANATTLKEKLKAVGALI